MFLISCTQEKALVNYATTEEEAEDWSLKYVEKEADTVYHTVGPQVSTLRTMGGSDGRH